MTTLTTLAKSLRDSLMDAASEFDRGVERGSLTQFQRLLQVALDDYSRRRPLIVLGRLQLEAQRMVYDCPVGLEEVQAFDWGRADKARLPVWADGWPGRLPAMRVSRDGDRRVLYLMPAPSARQISLLGSAATYRYRARHTLDEQGSTPSRPATSRWCCCAPRPRPCASCPSPTPSSPTRRGTASAPPRATARRPICTPC
ncbi:hypothetical protein JOS77_27000 [Chromobacterium haemolyticum]|nr:hypothetical protein JOS77_27000 [Chromobacterium haemolyticum]